MKLLLGIVALCAALFVAYTMHADARQREFVASMKEQHRGYRLEHLLDEKLLFLHRPDGGRQGMPLQRKCIEEVVLTKTPATETTFNKDLYQWQVRYARTVRPDQPHAWVRPTFMVPYFGVDPEEFLGILRRELPEIEAGPTLELARRLERDDCAGCVVWSNPKFDSKRPEPLPDMLCT